MSPDHASPAQPASDNEALAQEVRQLRALLAELQAELGGGLQSSLRERSSELQRIGGELHESREAAEQLSARLADAQTRAAELEREVDRWRGAATRGLQELEARTKATAARFEAQSAELNQALTALRGQLDASRTEADTALAARDAAAKALERTRRRASWLKAKVVRGEARRLQMQRSASWRLTAPLRWFSGAWGRLLLGGARLRRRLLRG